MLGRLGFNLPPRSKIMPPFLHALSLLVPLLLPSSKGFDAPLPPRGQAPACTGPAAPTDAPNPIIHATHRRRPTKGRMKAAISTTLLLLLPLALLLDVVQSQEQQQLPLSAFGTRPYNRSVQTVPGKVWFAFYDQGGEGNAFHTVDAVNHGSCELNPCTGVNATYLNTFRADEAVSVSYTKPWFWWANRAWSDRWAAGTPKAGENVPLDEFYVGWFVQGSWLRLTVNVTQPGRYAADMYVTCPSSGEFILSLNAYESGELVSKQVVTDVPKTVYFHDWEVLEGAAVMGVPEGGLYMLTVEFAKVGGDPKVHWGNLIWMDFHEV